MLCLSGFELYSRWVPLDNVREEKYKFEETRDLSKHTTVVQCRNANQNVEVRIKQAIKSSSRIIRDINHHSRP